MKDTTNEYSTSTGPEAYSGLVKFLMAVNIYPSNVGDLNGRVLVF